MNVHLVNVVTHCCDVRNPARHPNRSGEVLPNPRLRAGLALPALPEQPKGLNQDPAPSPGQFIYQLNVMKPFLS